MLPILSADLSRARRVGGAHEMPPVPAGDPADADFRPECGARLARYGPAAGPPTYRTQNTARDCYQ